MKNPFKGFLKGTPLGSKSQSSTEDASLQVKTNNYYYIRDQDVINQSEIDKIINDCGKRVSDMSNSVFENQSYKGSIQAIEAIIKRDRRGTYAQDLGLTMNTSLRKVSNWSPESENIPNGTYTNTCLQTE